MIQRRNDIELHVQGAWPASIHPWVAVVGARAATRSGLEQAVRIAGELVGLGAVVVSGGAMGIDAAAHRGALAAGGHTVAVLASLDELYPPRNLPLFAEILRRGGGLATPVMEPAGPGLKPWRFLARNKALAALVDAVIVVEAGSASGSLHTARAAAKAGRVVGAIPGSPGADALLARGAALIEGSDDVLAALGGTPRRWQPDLPPPETDEARTLAVLSPCEARTPEQIGTSSGLGALRAQRALFGLELEGWVQAVPGGRFVRAEMV